MVRTSSIATRFLVELLDEHRIDCDDLLAAAGLDRGTLAGDGLRTPWPVFAALWERAAAAQRDVGLALCERFPDGQMHMLTHLALRSASVGAALGACCRYFSAVSAIESLHDETDDLRATIVYTVQPGVAPIPWLVEHYFAMVPRVLARALDRTLPIVAVEFRATRNAPAAAYAARFGVAPRFAAARDAMSFDAACLAWPLPTRDAYLGGILERVAAEHAAKAREAPWSTLARGRLAELVLHGKPATLAATAAACGVGIATLRARLAAEQLTFRKLLDETRRALAEEHLGRGMSATSVAYLLGFSEPAAFQHACKRWFGKAAGSVGRTQRRAQ